MSENKLLDLSFEFAVAIISLVDGVAVPKSSYMTDQLARAGTSVGANIHETQYAHYEYSILFTYSKKQLLILINSCFFYFFLEIASSIALAEIFPAPIAEITVAAPVTASPPA